MDTPIVKTGLPSENLQLEYQALRAEILKRIGLRQTVVSLTLTIAGVLLAFGATQPTVALVYPPIAALLAISWTQYDLRINDLSTYIRDHLEPLLPGLGWETHVQQSRKSARGLRFVVLSHTGVFLLTQALAIGIGFIQFTGSPVELLLLIVDFFAILTVLWVIIKVRR